MWVSKQAPFGERNLNVPQQGKEPIGNHLVASKQDCFMYNSPSRSALSDSDYKFASPYLNRFSDQNDEEKMMHNDKL